MFTRVLATIGVLSTMLVVTASPAVARPSVKTGVAESCVKSYLNDRGFTDHLSVVNDCYDDQRIKVVLANHGDLACESINAGDTKKYSWSYPGRFDRLESC